MIYIWLFKEAFLSIFRHKLRSFFAIIGVAVGITAVISLVSIGKGVEKDVAKTVEGIGTNMIVILSGKIDTERGFDQSSMGNPANFMAGDILKRRDAEEVAKIEGVKAVSPIGIVSGSVRRGGKVSSSMVIGSHWEMSEIMTGVEVERGRFINDGDSDKKNIVVGEAVREQLFEDSSNIVGETVMIGEDEFEIIGQLGKPKDSGQLFSSDYEAIAVISMDEAKRLNDGNDKIMRIVATADNADVVQPTVDRIKEDMLKRHKDDEFSVLTQDQLLDMLSGIINILTTAVTAIAAISLIVGGIGISSVMFMSVADRTREIGIRKALGATSVLITFQFIIESVVLAILGGAAGLGLSLVVNEIVKAKSLIEPHITDGVIILALVFCMGVGVVFGLIPAIRGAQKDPVDALREG